MSASGCACFVVVQWVAKNWDRIRAGGNDKSWCKSAAAIAGGGTPFIYRYMHTVKNRGRMLLGIRYVLKVFKECKGVVRVFPWIYRSAECDECDLRANKHNQPHVSPVR
jgi:hypothetical protein